MANIYIRPLLPRPQLAERQERIKAGLLSSGVSMEEIRQLQWYDRSLEDQFTGMVDKNSEPQPIGDKKLSRAEKYRARRDGNG